MIRRPPRSTLDRSSAASDVYKRQLQDKPDQEEQTLSTDVATDQVKPEAVAESVVTTPVSYTHLRAHETVLDLVCRLLLEKKKKTLSHNNLYRISRQ